jgi:hypothetical protein
VCIVSKQYLTERRWIEFCSVHKLCQRKSSCLAAHVCSGRLTADDCRRASDCPPLPSSPHCLRIRLDGLRASRRSPVRPRSRLWAVDGLCGSWLPRGDCQFRMIGDKSSLTAAVFTDRIWWSWTHRNLRGCRGRFQFRPDEAALPRGRLSRRLIQSAWVPHLELPLMSGQIPKNYPQLRSNPPNGVAGWLT